MPHALQDSNLHFDVMNIKFYLLSQEFAAGDTYVGGREVGGRAHVSLRMQPPTHHIPHSPHIAADSHLLHG